MRVLVTGGTGFVGSHTVAAVLERGHDVRLLVRSPGRIAPALEPLGIGAVEHAIGDVTDAGSVKAAARGCDAVIHAAGVYSFSRRDARRIEEVNARGTEVVLGVAHRLGLDPIVHVSSYAALFPPDGRPLTTQSPVKSPPVPYVRAKAQAERAARRHQAAGAPVAITYPAGAWGPSDPHD